MRSGELRGLQWRDVDWQAGTVTVRRSLQRLDGTFRALEPKTAKSRRTLPLPEVALQALRDHRQQQAAVPVSGAYIFCQADGQPLHPTTARRALQTVLRDAGLPAMPFHALRRTAASLLLAQGTHPRVVMELLGHSTIALTMNTYSHVIPALEREAADQMERLPTRRLRRTPVRSLATDSATNATTPVLPGRLRTGVFVLRGMEATTGFEPVYTVLQTAPWPLGHVATRIALAAPRGFEPRFTDPKSAVLPLDDGASAVARG